MVGASETYRVVYVITYGHYEISVLLSLLLSSDCATNSSNSRFYEYLEGLFLRCLSVFDIDCSFVDMTWISLQHRIYLLIGKLGTSSKS